MFFRLKKTQSGQVLKLLESFRDSEGVPRHRTVVSLGNAEIAPRDYKVIARMVENHFYGQCNLFDQVDATDEIREWVDFIVRQVTNERTWTPHSSSTANSVIDDESPIVTRSSDVTHEASAELGPVLVANHAWNELGLQKTLMDCGVANSRIQATKISVINRLVDPVSENALLNWLRSTALADILSNKMRGAGVDRFYRASDSLLKHQKRIESDLRKRTQQLHNPDRTILLYDLTNTHFEGVCASNPKALRGKNKQGRTDCPQVVVGMVFDTLGFELGHHLFAGNQADSTSLGTMLKTMKEIVTDSVEPDGRTLVVMDSGMASAENLKLVTDAGYSYLINDRRPLRSRYKDKFLDKSKFKPIQGRKGKPPILVRYISPADQGNSETAESFNEGEQILLCMSEQRGEKEHAILSSAEKRLIESLEKLKRRVESGRLVVQEKIDHHLGRLAERHRRAWRYYEITADAETKSVQWSSKEDLRSEANDLCGGYVLRTNDISLDQSTIWQTYIALTTAENGFRELKSDLGLRPNYHQKEHRVDAHIFITVIAYQLLRHILSKLQKEGDTRSWTTIKRVLKTHAYATVVINNQQGSIHRIRKAGNPDESQKEIYRNLGINWNKLPSWHFVTEAKQETL